MRHRKFNNGRPYMTNRKSPNIRQRLNGRLRVLFDSPE